MAMVSFSLALTVSLSLVFMAMFTIVLLSQIRGGSKKILILIA